MVNSEPSGEIRGTSRVDRIVWLRYGRLVKLIPELDDLDFARETVVHREDQHVERSIRDKRK